MDLFFRFIEWFKRLFGKSENKILKSNKKVYTVELGRGSSSSNYWASYEVKGLSQILYYNDEHNDLYNHGSAVPNIALAILNIIELDQSKPFPDFDNAPLERAIKIHYSGDLEYKEFIIRLVRV